MPVIRFLLLTLFSLYLISCLPNNKLSKGISKAKDTVSIIVASFPFRDTATITFYQVDKMWYRKITYHRYGKISDTLHCSDCKAMFSQSFLNTLRNLRTEILSMDCRKYVDTIFDDNGDTAVGFEDFYMATHLETESIIIKTGSITTSIEYISPKEALLYCKNNVDRLKFIYMVDSLRSIR